MFWDITSAVRNVRNGFRRPHKYFHNLIASYSFDIPSFVFQQQKPSFATWSVIFFQNNLNWPSCSLGCEDPLWKKNYAKNIQAIGHYGACKMAKNGQNDSKTSKMPVFGLFSGSVASDYLYIFTWFNLQNRSSHLRLRFGWFRLSWKKSRLKLQKINFCCSDTIDGISNHYDAIKSWKYLWRLLKQFSTFYSAEVMS
jgi:hypothetical protein